MLVRLDAPPGTFLAYATAPGNLASDGEGANGLYTEQLLREIKVPEAKIDDVFKRVRLAVRLKSNGLQVPWESTSLERDFYFIPPRDAAPRKLEETESAFTEELALWESMKSSTDTRPLEDYLRRYPSGRFSELAQFRLDRLLEQKGEKVVRAPDAQRNSGNPFSKGTARVNTDFAVGDTYTYR